MSETVTTPKAKYDRLRAREADFADMQTALDVEARLATGEEELIPGAVVDRLLDGEVSPRSAWRRSWQSCVP